jgi:hypothetical protein
MKIKLIELRNSVPALRKLYLCDMSLKMADKISMFMKKLEPQLKTIDENQARSLEKNGIKDIKKAMDDNSPELAIVNKEMQEYLFGTEAEISDIEITWKDLEEEKGIKLSPADKDVLSLFIK